MRTDDYDGDKEHKLISSYTRVSGTLSGKKTSGNAYTPITTDTICVAQKSYKL